MWNHDESGGTLHYKFLSRPPQWKRCLQQSCLVSLQPPAAVPPTYYPFPYTRLLEEISYQEIIFRNVNTSCTFPSMCCNTVLHPFIDITIFSSGTIRNKSSEVAPKAHVTVNNWLFTRPTVAVCFMLLTVQNVLRPCKSKMFCYSYL